MSIKLNVDEIIKLDTIRYQRLADTDKDDGDDGGQSLLDDDEKNLNLLDEEDLTLLHGEDFSWFRRSVHFLLFFIGVAGLLLLALLILPRRYTAGASFENGFGIRIPLDFRRLDAQEAEFYGTEKGANRNEAKWKNTKLKQMEAKKLKEEEMKGNGKKSSPIHQSASNSSLLSNSSSKNNQTLADLPTSTSKPTTTHQKTTQTPSKPTTTQTPSKPTTTHQKTTPAPTKTAFASTKAPKLNQTPSNQQNSFSTSFDFPRFVRPEKMANLECKKFFTKGVDYRDYRKHRITFSDPNNDTDLPMECDAIKGRAYFQTEDLYPEERAFPIAYARAVFKDYRFLEMELAASYAPQNFYCFALDSNASPLFHKRMQALAKCFPNVLLTTHEFHMDSAGHNMGYSHYECMKLLAKRELNWKYIVLLQNHDVALKTNQELVQIYKWFNGTNDISAKIPPRERINSRANWTFEALHLFKNETRNLLPYKGYKPVMRFSKSLVQVSVSRAMIEFVLNDLDMTQLMKQIEWKAYGIDEILMGSLNAADAVEAPGGYTDYCIDHHKVESAVTRLTHWAGGGPCRSQMWRHGICLLGMEHLQELSDCAQLFGNKFMPDRDAGAIFCWHEHLFNRTHFDRGTHRLKENFYLNLPHVRFNRERKQKGAAFDVKNFNC